jgi:hypothetical protein
LKLEIAANALPNMNFEEERETLAKVERHIAEARKYTLDNGFSFKTSSIRANSQ